MDITYTLNLTITRPVYLHDTEGNLKDTAEWMESKEALREIEREVLQALRKIDGDCDVEVMDTEAVGPITEDDEPEEPCLPDGTPIYRSRMTRTERQQGMADRGCDTREEARSER